MIFHFKDTARVFRYTRFFLESLVRPTVAHQVTPLGFVPDNAIVTLETVARLAGEFIECETKVRVHTGRVLVRTFGAVVGTCSSSSSIIIVGATVTNAKRIGRDFVKGR